MTTQPKLYLVKLYLIIFISALTHCDVGNIELRGNKHTTINICSVTSDGRFPKEAKSNLDVGIESLHSHTKCGPGAIWKTIRFAQSWT